MLQSASNYRVQPVAESAAAFPKGGWRWPAFCAFAVMAAMLLTLPFGEVSLIDDWSFMRTARDFAETGRLIYNQWSAPLVGPQAIWAALFIKIFGFSRSLVRLTELPLAGLGAVILYMLGRRLRLSPAIAAFGTLSILLSPLVLPLIASFMTDFPSLLFLLVCFYGSVRSLQEPVVKQAIWWLVVATVFSMIGGTIRQTCWFGVIFVFPALAWQRRQKPYALAAALLWLATLAFVALALAWYKAQPFSVPDKSLSIAMLVKGFTSLLGVRRTMQNVLTPILFICGPALVWCLTGMNRREFRRLLTFGTIIVVLLVAGRFFLKRWFFMPFHEDMGHVFSVYGVSEPGSIAVGEGRYAMPSPLLLIYTSFLFTALLWFCRKLLLSWRSARARGESVLASSPGPAEFLSGPYAWLSVFVPFTVCYLAFILPRFHQNGIYDRYAVPLLPGAVFFVLWFAFRVPDPEAAVWVKRPTWIPAVAYSLLGLIGIYSIGVTHDYYELQRTIEGAVNKLALAGVPRRDVCAGLASDGWAQLELLGRTTLLPNGEEVYRVYQRLGSAGLHMTVSEQWMRAWGPQMSALRYRYWVTLSPMYDLLPPLGGPIVYTTWLPPRSREIYIQETPPELWAKVFGAQP